jgi:hypothetical protein
MKMKVNKKMKMKKRKKKEKKRKNNHSRKVLNTFMGSLRVAIAWHDRAAIHESTASSNQTKTI